MPEHLAASTDSRAQNAGKHDSSVSSDPGYPTAQSESTKRDGMEKRVRRFSPQPVETTVTLSRDRRSNSSKQGHATRRSPDQSPVTDSATSSSGSSRVRFPPQLLETTHGGNRKCGPASNENAKRRSRQFKPEVLSTARRSRRANEDVPRDQEHRTEDGHDLHALEQQIHAGRSRKDGRFSTGDQFSPTTEADRQMQASLSVVTADSCILPHPIASTKARTPSFRCPELDTIESSESERESTHASTSGSAGQCSPITGSDSSFHDFYKHATRIRESVDESVNHDYLRAEARKAAQRKLQEQALAAFPNSDYHEPVHHYVDDDRDSVDAEIEDRPVTWECFDDDDVVFRHRRESTKTPWERLELQQHARELEEERMANRVTASKPVANSPWWNPVDAVSNRQADGEIRSMRDRARPPMLGHDLVFPRCPSPQPARFDVTQGCEQLRQQMSRESQGAGVSVQSQTGLWTAPATDGKPAVDQVPKKSSLSSSPSRGLWSGFCLRKKGSSGEDDSGTRWRTGLLTPAPRKEPGNPFEQSFHNSTGKVRSIVGLAPTPSGHDASDPALLNAALEKSISEEDILEQQFPDAFITQVFNYLSLGYPTIARPFDEELAKISKIPISQLRQDDAKAKQNPRGYIRLGPDFEQVGSEECLRPQDCVRWRALRLYVHEWARQEENMRTDSPGGNWATSNRRGSWAW